VFARVLYRQGSHRAALGHAQRASALYRDAAHPVGQAAALNAVGWFHSLLDDHRQALIHCQEALDLHRLLGDQFGEAAAWDSLGYAHHHLDHHADAVSCYQQALDLWRRLGDRFNEADTDSRLGDVLQSAGDTEAACAVWEDARKILEALRHPDATELSAKLDSAARAVCA
jgi:tetratricopeptide (TPR) repeat protein